MDVGEGSWRRVSDWKTSIEVVLLEDLDPAFLAARGLEHPVERLRPDYPRLAELLQQLRFVRVEPQLAADVRGAGFVTTVVGYHRGADGLSYRERGPHEDATEDVDMAELVGRMSGVGDDDARYDECSEDAVDAVLRMFSEDLLTEAALIVAAVVPPLSGSTWTSEQRSVLEAHEAIDRDTLPDVDEAFVERVVDAFAQTKASPPGPIGVPPLSLTQRRTYQRQCAVVGAVAILLAVLASPFTPWVAVAATPLVVLCLVVVALHEAVIRQG